jgi:ribosome-binding factor A
MAEEIREQVSDILHNHLADPRLGWISVIRVELSRDLHYATLYISVLGSETAQSGSLRVLSRARNAVRAELARRLRSRKAPEIVFRADHSVEASLRIGQILKELGLSGGGEDSAGSEGGEREEKS